MVASGNGMVGGLAESSKAALKRRTPYRFRSFGRFRPADSFVRGAVAIIAGILCASFASAEPRGAGQQQAASDACAPVQAAYQKTASTSDSSNATNTGSINVAEAYEKITSEAGRRETCKYLRDEAVTGEDANVYSDVFASKSGTANGTVWISKKNGWVLKREVDVEMTGVGKGHQSIVFEYPKK
jgi:hypothetical protein